MPRPLNWVKPDIAGYKALGHGGFGQVNPIESTFSVYDNTASGGSSRTVLDYPGLPNGHSMVATPLTSTQLASLSAANAAYFGGASMPVQSTSQAWFSTNWTWLALGGLVGLIILSMGGRSR